jgi:hypothetical protein
MLLVLLPWRGAVAAAMLCPPAAMPASHGAHGHHGHDNNPPPAADAKCQLCAATCALSTLLAPALSLPQPPAMAAAAFPPLVALAPEFLSSGQERPPRSI